MDFFKDPLHLALAAAAAASGSMLLFSYLRRNPDEVGPAAATLLINRENATVIDVREPPEFFGGHIAGSRNIPLAKLAERLGELDSLKEQPLVLTCAAGSRSASALKILQQAGFTQAKSLAGGVSAWKEAGLPLSRKGNK